SPAAAASFRVAAPAGSTAGGAFAVTVTALDAYGNVVTNYAGTVSFTSSDGRATLPAGYTFTSADAGAHTFAGVTFVTAGNQSLTVTGPSARGGAVVAVSPAAAASFRVAAAAGSTAGSVLGVTVTALDAYGNVATGYRGTVALGSSDTQAGLPAAYTFTA